MNLTTITIARNAEKTIARCINSLTFSQQRLVILDPTSTDQTESIARSHGATVIKHTWPGFGPQKNFGLKQATGDWVLFIDADEEVPNVLAQEIKQAINTTNHSLYWLRITTTFLNRPLHHLFGHNPRLFRQGKYHWNNAAVHEQVIAKNNNQPVTLNQNQSAILSVALIHHSHQTIKSYLARMRQYTTLDAEQMHSTRKHRSGRPIKPHLLLPYQLALRQFIKLLIYRRGLFDGYPGFTWSTLSAYYEYEMGKKFIRLCA